MAARKKEKDSLLGKEYLYALGVAFLVLASFRGFDTIGKLFKSFSWSSAARQERAAEEASRKLSEELRVLRTDIESFNEWFLDDEGARAGEVIIIRAENAITAQTVPTKTRRSLWPVPVNGTMYTEGAWIAAVGSHVLEVGSIINPSSDLCGYQVISISRNSVWFVPLMEDNMKVDLDLGIRLPDMMAIHYAEGGKFIPERLEVRRNLFLHKEDKMKFKNTGSELVLKHLWPMAANFRYHSADDAVNLDLICVLVR